MKKEDMLFVYDKELSDYLQQNGAELITTAYAVSTGKQFYMYARSDEIHRLLRKFNNKFKATSSL